MAKQSITSITVDKAQQHMKSASYRGELPCDKIIGFHLQKGGKGGTYKFRYTGQDGKRKIIKLGKYVDGKADRIQAAETALAYRSSVESDIDPKLAVEQERLIKKNVFIKNQTGSIDAYLNGTYAQHQSRKKNNGNHTLNIIKSNFTDYLDVSMMHLTSAMIKDWQANKEQAGRSYATIQRAYGALKTMLNHAVTEGAIDSNPLSNCKLLAATHDETVKSIGNDDKLKRRMLTMDELIALNSAGVKFKNDCELRFSEGSQSALWFYYFFRLAAYTGLRPGDLYSLTWTELNLNFKRLRKTPQKTMHHREPIVVDLQLNDDITEIMKQWYAICGKPSQGTVFANPNTGKSYDRQAHRKYWNRVLKLANLGDSLDFYSLRHHFISKMVSSGVPLFTVARLAGHKSTKMIESHYGHLAPNASADPLSLVANDFQSVKVAK